MLQQSDIVDVKSLKQRGVIVAERGQEFLVALDDIGEELWRPSHDLKLVGHMDDSGNKRLYGQPSRRSFGRRSESSVDRGVNG